VGCRQPITPTCGGNRPSVQSVRPPSMIRRRRPVRPTRLVGSLCRVGYPEHMRLPGRRMLPGRPGLAADPVSPERRRPHRFRRISGTVWTWRPVAAGRWSDRRRTAPPEMSTRAWHTRTRGMLDRRRQSGDQGRIARTCCQRVRNRRRIAMTCCQRVHGRDWIAMTCRRHVRGQRRIAMTCCRHVHVGRRIIVRVLPRVRRCGRAAGRAVACCDPSLGCPSGCRSWPAWP
jgi:hypothetical protein